VELTEVCPAKDVNVAARRAKPKQQAAKRQGIAERLRSVVPRNSVRRVAVVFVLILGVLLPLALFSGGWAGWGPITRTVAGWAGACMRAVGIKATVEGNVILLPSRSLSVDPQCTAVDLLAVYTALVLAYPLRWKMRLLALVLGAVVLQVANIARLVGVAWASEVLVGRSFYVVHDYLFEFGMVFVVLMMWAAWLSFAQRSA
jgi:exosortase/archaeosortase family protein